MIKQPLNAMQTVLTTALCYSVLLFCVCACGGALPSSPQGPCCSIGWNPSRGSRTQPRIPAHPAQDAAWCALLSESSSPRCQLSLLLLFHYQLSGQATREVRNSNCPQNKEMLQTFWYWPRNSRVQRRVSPFFQEFKPACFTNFCSLSNSNCETGLTNGN